MSVLRPVRRTHRHAGRRSSPLPACDRSARVAFQAADTHPSRWDMISAESSESRPSRCAVLREPRYVGRDRGPGIGLAMTPIVI
jgi:hypothetical protein